MLKSMSVQSLVANSGGNRSNENETKLEMYSKYKKVSVLVFGRKTVGVCVVSVKHTTRHVTEGNNGGGQVMEHECVCVSSRFRLRYLRE